jgi:hypothetical protein
MLSFRVEKLAAVPSPQLIKARGPGWLAAAPGVDAFPEVED